MYEVWGWSSRRLMGDMATLFGGSRIRWALDEDSWCIPLTSAPFSFTPPHPLDPASTMTWSISTFPGDHHCTHFRVYEDYPSVFPIIVATQQLWDVVDYHVGRQERFALFKDLPRTLTGDDEYVILITCFFCPLTLVACRDTQTIVRMYIEMLRNPIYREPIIKSLLAIV